MFKYYTYWYWWDIIKKLNGSSAVKVFDTGTSQFYENIIADKNLTVYGTSSFNSDLTISATRNNATSVEMRLQNLGSGYASSFFNHQVKKGRYGSETVMVLT